MNHHHSRKTLHEPSEFSLLEIPSRSLSLQHLWTTGDVDWATEVFRALDFAMKYGTLEGVMITGQMANGKQHVVAISRDPFDPHRAKLYNHGVSGREQLLYSFYERYPNRLYVSTYSLFPPSPQSTEHSASARQRLKFQDSHLPVFV